jgi:putative ATP-binding cassette transporter
MKKYLLWLVIFAAIEIGLALYLTMWREDWWNAVSTKNSTGFLTQLGVFSLVALFICFVSGFSGYLLSLTTIKWREQLNEKAFSVPEKTNIENYTQRVQEDCWSYPDLTLTLLFGTVKAIFYILVFSISLIYSFHWYYLGILVTYAVVGSLLTKRIALPLISLNYQQQRVEATYRSFLCVENFKKCVHIMLGLAKKQKHLTYFQQFYGQVGVVIPLIIIAPVYFSTGMTLGMLMRFNSVGSTILENMSYGINSFGNINKLLSCRKRLKEAGII